MRLPATLSVSVLAHVVVIFAARHTLFGASIPVRERAATPISLVEPAPVEIEATPVEFVIVPRAAIAPVPAGIATPASRPPRGHAATQLAATVNHGGETHGETATTAIEPPSHGTGMMAMRQPGEVDLDISLPESAIRDAIDGGPPLPDKPLTSGRLETHAGKIVGRDLVTTLEVEPDGTGHFNDKGDGEVHFALPIPSRKGLGRMLESWAEDPYAQTNAAPIQDLNQVDRAVPGGWDSGAGGGSPSSEAASSRTVPVIGGGFDITSWAMRKAGGDPYYSRKRKLLDQTRDERVAQGTVHRAAQLERAGTIMRTNIQRMWTRVIDPDARRAALFELWDECEEGDGPTGVAGQAARDQVIGWIRGHLPEGSSEAYSADELTALDAGRHSTQRFAPY